MLLIILIALSAWIFDIFLPWWSLAIPCLILGAWLGKSGLRSFLFGFLGIGILWLAQATVTHMANHGVLTARVAELFNLPQSYLMILITMLIGGLAGGLSTLTGYYFRTTFGKAS